MIQVVNREPAAGQAGRVKLTLDDGTIMEGVLEMSDGADPEGTPWNAQTGRLLQADIRAYPAATAITAGDVVDISNGQATTDGTPSQGIALQTVQAGSDVDVIFSGITYAEWAADGQIIDSPGVQGFCPVNGALMVIPNREISYIIVGTYTGNGSDPDTSISAVTQKINLGVTPKFLILLKSHSGNQNSYNFGDVIVAPYGIPYYDTRNATHILLEVVNGGFEVTYRGYGSGSSRGAYDPEVNALSTRYLYIAVI